MVQWYIILAYRYKDSGFDPHLACDCLMEWLDGHFLITSYFFLQIWLPKKNIGHCLRFWEDHFFWSMRGARKNVLTYNNATGQKGHFAAFIGHAASITVDRFRCRFLMRSDAAKVFVWLTFL